MLPLVSALHSLRARGTGWRLALLLAVWSSRERRGWVLLTWDIHILHSVVTDAVVSWYLSADLGFLCLSEKRKRAGFHPTTHGEPKNVDIFVYDMMQWNGRVQLSGLAIVLGELRGMNRYCFLCLSEKRGRACFHPTMQGESGACSARDCRRTVWKAAYCERKDGYFKKSGYRRT